MRGEEPIDVFFTENKKTDTDTNTSSITDTSSVNR